MLLVLTLGAVHATFGAHRDVGAVLLMAAGAICILSSQQLALVHHSIRDVIASPFAPARPTTFVLFGIGLIVVGIAWLIAA
jgi:hypothetical protein